MAYNNLRFFDSDSNELNLAYSEPSDMWVGSVYFPEVSTGLYETITLHILENIGTKLTTDDYNTPISNTPGNVSFKFKFNNDYGFSEDIFLYGAELQNGEISVVKQNSQSVALLDSSIATVDANGYKRINDDPVVEPIIATIALNSETEGRHTRYLSIIEVVDGVETGEIALIQFYGEVVGEDERLRTLLTNIGMNLDDLDYFIFKDSNINEQSPDHILLNEKRKELLLQASEIKPFIGTYKALLNAIDFFGYDKITLKEYWLNINEQSENFGKLKAIAVPNQDVVGFLADKNKGNNLPNSSQKKTSRFSLVYRLNTPTGDLDKWDIPTVKEVMDYSPDEVLIKLYGLKKKLQKDYLPLQAKIVDITGEGDYFSQFNQNVWNNQHSIKTQDAGIEFTPEKIPALRDIFIEDLRMVDYRLTGFNQDFNSIPASDKLEICDSIKAFYTEYYNKNLNTFNTIDGIPIGAPLVLKVEEGLEDTWDFANFSWLDAEDTEVSNVIQELSTDDSLVGVGNLNTYIINHDQTLSNLLTWENWWHRGVYEIEWKIIGPKGYDKSFRGPVYEFNNFPLTLPYEGSYTVESILHDLYNVSSTKIHKDWINVKNKNVEVYGITQLSPKELNWQEYEYDWKQAGSDWNWSRENTLPVRDSIGTYYLSMDRANYVQDQIQYGAEFSTVRRYADINSPDQSGFNETAGPYQWAELSSHKWEDGPEITWKMTRVGSDINSSFQINIGGATQGYNFIIKQATGTGGSSIVDSYVITSPFPTDSLDLQAWEDVALELNNIDPSEHPIISKFNFNAIFKDTDGNQQTGFPTQGADECIYILAVAEEPARTHDFEDVYFSNQVGGTISGKLNFISYNPGFNDTYIINGLVDLHRLNHVTFSYDLTNMPGIVSQEWQVINNTLKIDDIYYSNPILTYLFKEKGYYTVKLTLKDSNGNKNIITKNILNII
jgi:hypothetical protein